MIAALFPGQGSQEIGMGKALYEGSRAAREALDRAEAALPGLLKLMWEGPEEELKLTANQQPALLAVGYAPSRPIWKWAVRYPALQRGTAWASGRPMWPPAPSVWKTPCA